MKLKYFIISQFLIISFANPILAQIEWEILNPIPTSADLKSVQFINTQTGWAIGSYGNIIHTNDGGETWNFQNANIDHISDLYFIDNNFGWAIGMKFTGENVWGIAILKSYLLKTVDSGYNWIIQSGFDHEYSSGPYPFSIYFINRDIGWIASSVQNSEKYNSLISKTSNGGETWVVQDSIELSIHDIYFINDKIGWAVGGWSSAFDVCIKKTINGGDTWISQTGKVKGVLESVFFINESVGWTVGTGNTILKTTDGGDNWIYQSKPGSAQHMTVCFSDSNNGYITGWDDFLKTNDGGENWIKDNIGRNTYLSVTFINPQIGWRVGTRGVIQKTTDGGNNWTFQSRSFTNSELTSIDFVDKNYSWMANAENKLFNSKNGGKNWDIINKPSNEESLFSLDFIDSLTGYLSCGNGIYKTTNGGNNWEKIYSLNLESYMQCITYFQNSENGWVIYDQGKIIHTSDGGLNWTIQYSHTCKTFFDIHFINETHGWIVGQDGLMLKTEDSGENWEKTEIPELTSDIVKVDFIDSLKGWILANIESNDDGIPPADKALMYSLDGGKTWINTIINEGYSSASDLEFIDENNGWILGLSEATYQKTLYHTKDKGLTWEKILIPPQYGGPNKIDFISSHEGWLLGPNGTVIHLTFDKISDIKDKFLRPREMIYMISQNYPNPFNPSTKIKYKLTKSGHIELKIYNLTGQEVETLVNKFQLAGEYEITWRPKGLSSGLYFYKIQTKEFSVTRKLTFLK